MTQERDVIDLRDKKFVMVGRSIMENTDKLARPTDKLVYVMLCMYADNKTKSSYPSAERLAKLCHCSERSVRNSLKRLKEVGLIRIEIRHDARGFRTSNRYFLLEPPDDF
jgi:biotin operon repressor